MSEPRKVLKVTDLERMTPQERADTVEAAAVTSWDDVPEPFRSEVLATARQLGDQRRAHD